MKRWLVMGLIFILLLSGCARDEISYSVQESGESEFTQESEDESSQEEEFSGEPQREAAMLVGKQALSSQDLLWYIPSRELEEMFMPDIKIFQDKLLAMAIAYSDYTEMIMEVQLKLFDLYSGELLGEVSLETSSFFSVQMNEHQIGIADSGEGWVKIFDNTMELRQEYDMAEREANWYLSRDMKTLYHFGYDQGIYAIDLATQTRRELVPDAIVGYANSDAADEIVFEYVDKTTYRYENKVLDLRTKELRDLPFDGALGWVWHVGETWLYYTEGKWDQYQIVSAQAHQFESEDTFRLLEPQGRLQRISGDGLSTTLYHEDGTFIADCEFTEDYYQSPLVWCELYQGYFFVSYGGDETSRLCFWEAKQESGGEDLLCLPREEESVSGGQTAEAKLYERAQKMSEIYGVDIRISDQCQLRYDEFWGTRVDDTERITEALDKLEQTLNLYPKGFFSQLLFGHLDRIQIELIGDLQRDNVPEGATYSEFAAFAQEKNDHYLVVVDVTFGDETTYNHEFSHIIDKRLEWGARCRPGALFDEQDWYALSPEGFEYAYSYYDVPYELWDEDYFIDLYACTYPTEDRARIFEHAMLRDDLWFPEGSGLEDKLEYYCMCIRDCFNTEGWPEITTWETVLESQG